MIAMAVSLILSSTTVAQMYGKSSDAKTAPAAAPGATAGEAKPGTVLPSGVIVATPITKQEAAKKQSPPSAGYPTGERSLHAASGLIMSPYSPHKEFDCSKINHGDLVLDTYANKVFVRP